MRESLTATKRAESSPAFKNTDRFFKPAIQPKLTINQPNDIYEQEADAMADKVMRMKEPSSEKKFFPPPIVQRKCPDCEEEEKQLQRKENNNEPVQASSQNSMVGDLQAVEHLAATENNFLIQRDSWDVDEPNCTTTLNWSLGCIFMYNSETRESWTPTRQTAFMNAAKPAVENAINSSNIKLTPSNSSQTSGWFRTNIGAPLGIMDATVPCPCPAGFSPKVNLSVRDEGPAGTSDWHSFAYANTSGTNRQSEASSSAEVFGELDEMDVVQRGDISQTPIVHEFGHSLGLSHPGEGIAGADEYAYSGTDVSGNQVSGTTDLMGVGMGLQPFYFDMWKNYLNENYAGCNFTTGAAPATSGPATGAPSSSATTTPVHRKSEPGFQDYARSGQGETATDNFFAAAISARNAAHFFKPAAPIIQRTCSHWEEEDSSFAKASEDKKEKQLQRKDTNDEAPGTSSETENYVSSLAGGNELSKDQRNFFEGRMGYDFSNVRLHTDSTANESAKTLHALAYTHKHDIVFAANQYQPNTDDGKKLLAHELTHVVQQNSPEQVMRAPNPRPTSPTDLSSYSEANRRRITYDTDDITINPAPHFQQGIVETPRAGFDIDYVFTGTIASWLQPPLRSIARALFALQQSDTDPVRVNSTIIKALDLSPFHENNNSSGAAGPNTRFRFTCTEFDASGSGRTRTRNVQIIIEDIGLQRAIPNASETAAQRIARFARDYGFTRVDANLFNDNDFNRVLIAISLVPDNILRSIRDTPFNRISGQAVGPNGEAAEYSWTNTGGTFTRVINIYDNALAASTSAESLAFLMTHEIGHAVAHRPAEASGTAAQTDLSAETGAGSFREAATSDGGLTKAITVYGRTGWGEYFAEAFSMFINHPDTLRLLRPHVYQYFTTRFPAPAAATQPATP